MNDVPNPFVHHKQFEHSQAIHLHECLVIDKLSAEAAQTISPLQDFFPDSLNALEEKLLEFITSHVASTCLSQDLLILCVELFKLLLTKILCFDDNLLDIV